MTSATKGKPEHNISKTLWNLPLHVYIAWQDVRSDKWNKFHGFHWTSCWNCKFEVFTELNSANSCVPVEQSKTHHLLNTEIADYSQREKKTQWKWSNKISPEFSQGDYFINYTKPLEDTIKRNSQLRVLCTFLYKCKWFCYWLPPAPQLLVKTTQVTFRG